MKILISSEWYEPIPNGVVTSIINLKRELENMGHEVRVLTMSRDIFTYKSNGIYYFGSLNFSMVYPNARLSFFRGRELLGELINWKPDIIHSQTEFSSFFYAKRISQKTGAPQVHTYHTVYEDYTHYFSLSKRVGVAEIKYLTNKLLSRVDSVIVPTEKTKKLLERYNVRKHIDVIPSGINLNKHNSIISTDERVALREKYGISADDKLLVFVGRVGKEKNLGELISLVQRMPDVKLMIVGDGPFRNELEDIVSGLDLRGRIVFTGMVNPIEVSKYYQAGDLFTSASTSETQGLTYIEALANGLPVLARKDPCLNDVVIDGVNGWQFVTGTEFLKCAKKYFKSEDLQGKMKKSAKESSKKFSSEVFANSCLEVYKTTIKRKRRRRK
ncbi:MAG: glycosyltransferase family 4 protein [Tissierellia bacterium]|nr:glycosyltransferase family 4 protein [Tissierellia bacterium]